MRKSKWFILVCALACCTRIQTGVVYEPPPEKWKWEGEVFTQESYDYWWEIFHDKQLSDLIVRAFENNPTLDSAFGKVYESRAFLLQNTSYLFPQLTLDPSASRSGSLQRTMVPGVFERMIQSQIALPVNMNWEIDLFAKLRYSQLASYASYEAQKAAYHNVWLLLSVDVATAYYRLQATLRVLKILKDTIISREESLEITSARHKGGLTNFIDVTRAEVELEKAKTEYFFQLQLKAVYENMLATLTGTPAPEFFIETERLINAPPPPPQFLPSDLLTRRPDILEAQYRLLSSSYLITAAKMNFFPSLFFSGALGYASPTSNELLSWKSRYWAWGLSLSQTLLDFGYNQSQLEIAQSRFIQVLADNENLILRAFQETEDALAASKFTALQNFHAKKAVAAAQDTVDLSRDRYVNGLINYLDVVDAERQLLITQREEVLTLLDQYTSLLNIIKAIGGCW